ncbi:hypothetical protein K8S17_00450, partial [bacterium]|nr:hypothetical protein [bacterium]
VYGALFARLPDGSIQRETDDAALAPAEAARWALECAAGDGCVLFAGSGAVVYRDEIAAAAGDRSRFDDGTASGVPPAVLASLAERAGVDGASDARSLEPVYIRGAVAATPSRGTGQGGA